MTPLIFKSPLAEYHHHYNSNLVEDQFCPKTQYIHSMPDPENKFWTMFKKYASSTNLVLSFPNVWDADGYVITPDEYEHKLVDGSIIFVNVSLKLYVICEISFHIDTN